MNDYKFFDILLKGKKLADVRREFTPRMMHIEAEKMGISKRVAKRYARIADRFHDWENRPAKSVRALDELASCELVTNLDITRRTRQLDRLMNTRQARQLVVECIVRDNPVIGLVLPYGYRVATHKEVRYWEKVLYESPEDFVRHAYATSMSRGLHVPNRASGITIAENLVVKDYSPTGEDEEVLMTGMFTKVSGGY